MVAGTWAGSPTSVNDADLSTADSGTADWVGNLARLHAVERRPDPVGLCSVAQSVHP